MANFYGNDPFFNNDMDDVFNQLFRRMGNQNSERARYLVNGQSLTPDEFTQYRATGKLPQNNKTIEVSKDGKQAVKKGGILEKLGTNLTEQARDGLLDPVIGREKEIQETAEILCRRTKNNAILVGDAGVGKTAVVEGLAQAIVAGKVPETIQDKEIYSIDLSSLEAGTQYRGSFEENIKQLVEEVKAAGNIILFFDEIHQILGTGATGGEDGGKGLADIIKPALSRGELSVIGATTQDEYRNTILKNAALARRFNDVVINEPTAADTLRILQGVKELYEKHHHVVLPDDVLKAAVDYSIQYIPQRTLPDKAIDLIDMTAAHLAAKNSQTDVETLDQRLKKLEAAKEAAIKSEDFTKAADIKKSIEDKKGDRVKKAVIAEGSTFRYEPPEWMTFKTPMMQQVFETIRNTDFVIGKGGKVSFPKAFDQFEIVFDGMRHALGIGGLHSTESNRSVHSDNQNVLIDADVASQYPNIIMKLGLFPKALGKDFLTVYGGIIEKRLKAKARAKVVNREIDECTDPARMAELKAEKARLAVEDKGAKIMLNGSYGKLGSPYSVLFAPHLMVAVTLTGQLSLLMLIEEAHLRGIPVVSANTDGVLFNCPRTMFNGFVMHEGKPTDRLVPSPIQDIIDWWEGVTSFKMEFGEYRAVYSQSVNTYMAITPDGSYKRKGVLANHWRAETPWGARNSDYDPGRSGLMKNMQMTICADAALGLILNGTPVEQTIRECRDVREFITVVNATGGAMWAEPVRQEFQDKWRNHWSDTNWVWGDGPHHDMAGIYSETRPEPKLITRGGDEKYLGKVVRYYWSTNGAPIIKVKAHPSTGNRPKVSKTDGCRPLMTLPDDFAVPDDLDYGRYIAEAENILRDIGYHNRETVAAPSILESVYTRALQIN